MKTIRINVSNLRSIRNAAKTLEAYAHELQKKQDEIMRRSAELAATTAEGHYASGFIDENTDVTVSVSPVSGGYMVTASGDDVYFLEFGSGVAAGNGYDTSVIEPPVSIEPKSWSETQGTGEFAKYGSWHYQKVKYTMTVPRMGMYFGVKEAEAQLNKIAEEVFDD